MTPPPATLRDRTTLRLADAVLRIGLTRRHRTALEHATADLRAAVETVTRNHPDLSAVAELARTHHQLTGCTPRRERT